MSEATIRDVARHAQLSVASVSRALNGHKSVRPETRARVIAVADELGYVPHAGARSLSMARSNAIGVVLPDLHGEFFSEIVRGMDREASRLGLQLLLSNMHADPSLASERLRAMHGRVDGLLIMSPHGCHPTMPRGIPGVFINSAEAGGVHPGLRIDNRAGVQAVARHLVAIGRRSIVHISGPDDNLDARERCEGFVQAMAEHAPGAVVTVLEGDFSEEGGERAAQRILSEGLIVDAIFAANDMMAVGCLHGLRSAGVRVPDQVAMVGFDDVPLARYLDLTTIRVGIAEIGARAVVRLAQLMDGTADEAEPVEWHVPELVVRRTT